MLFAYWQLGDWTPYALFGLVFGLTTGLAQSLVLGRWVAQPLGWILATAFGEACNFAGLGFLFHIHGSLWDSLLIIGLTASLLGFAQWLLLRRWVKNAIWWIPATASGKVIGAIFVASLAARSDFGFDAVIALQTPSALITAATLSVLFRDTQRLFPLAISPKPLDL